MVFFMCFEKKMLITYRDRFRKVFTPLVSVLNSGVVGHQILTKSVASQIVLEILSKNIQNTLIVRHMPLPDFHHLQTLSCISTLKVTLIYPDALLQWGEGCRTERLEKN